MGYILRAGDKGVELNGASLRPSGTGTANRERAGNISLVVSIQNYHKTSGVDERVEPSLMTGDPDNLLTMFGCEVFGLSGKFPRNRSNKRRISTSNGG